MLFRRLESCTLCPHQCRINRTIGRVGRCGIGDRALFSTALCHRGEEPPLTGGAGSGTVFMAGCIARCCFCQNYQISVLRQGDPVTPEQLADIFLSLQQQGCSNLNWVTPSPHLPFLLEGLALAVEQGLAIPLVYNCNGYQSLDVVETLDGIVDIYLPDMKYSEEIWAIEYSGLPDYPDINLRAVKEMYRQVGVLRLNADGHAVSGLLVRHLVLPENRSGTAGVLRSIASIDPDIPLSLMAQYRPCFEAVEHPVLGRPLFREEYLDALEQVEIHGLTHVYAQSIDSLHARDGYFPDFGAGPGPVFRQD